MSTGFRQGDLAAGTKSGAGCTRAMQALDSALRSMVVSPGAGPGAVGCGTMRDTGPRNPLEMKDAYLVRTRGE
jgi:hypothetical protein